MRWNTKYIDFIVAFYLWFFVLAFLAAFANKFSHFKTPAGTLFQILAVTWLSAGIVWSAIMAIESGGTNWSDESRRRYAMKKFARCLLASFIIWTISLGLIKLLGITSERDYGGLQQVVFLGSIWLTWWGFRKYRLHNIPPQQANHKKLNTHRKRRTRRGTSMGHSTQKTPVMERQRR